MPSDSPDDDMWKDFNEKHQKREGDVDETALSANLGTSFVATGTTQSLPQQLQAFLPSNDGESIEDTLISNPLTAGNPPLHLRDSLNRALSLAATSDPMARFFPAIPEQQSLQQQSNQFLQQPFNPQFPTTIAGMAPPPVGSIERLLGSQYQQHFPQQPDEISELHAFFGRPQQLPQQHALSLTEPLPMREHGAGQNPLHASATASGSELAQGEILDLQSVKDMSSTFQGKLYQMIEETEKAGKDDIISWLPDGTAFAIHDSDRFESEVMPQFFKSARMPSFHRQLNLYGFRRYPLDKSINGFYHDSFQRDKKHLLKNIKRKKRNVPSGSGDPSNDDIAIFKAMSVLNRNRHLLDQNKKP